MFIRTLLCTLITISIHADNTSSFVEFFNEANTYYHKKEYRNAIASYEKALTLNSEQPQVYFNLGLAYEQIGNKKEALAQFKSAIAVNKNYVKAYIHAANILKELKQYEEAIILYDAALEREPHSVDALLNKAHCLNEMYKFDESIALYRRVIELAPDNTQALLNLANALNTANYIEDSLEIYYRVLKKVPHSQSVQYNIAYTLKKLGRVNEAIPLYESVLEKSPDYAEAHFGLGLSYLLLGNWERGWPEYEWRWKRSGGDKERTFTQPTWDGSPLYNKTILLHAEQGLGDTFQFVRYAYVAKERSAQRVIVAVQKPLLTLLKECPYIDEVVPLHSAYPHFDVQAALVSMPHICKTRIETAPHRIPYLFAHPDLINVWKQKLSHDTNFKIGICWQGNPNYSTHFLRVAVAAKSINANQFAPLSHVPGVSVYSLQHNTGTEQLEHLDTSFKLHHFEGEDFDNTHGRFMDTAALMVNLDLVITIDTSIAHLAAGLGVPVWIMIPNPPDWRWMLDCDTSPWYPNMKLFRQPIPGDWDSVLHSIENELRALLGHQSTTISYDHIPQLIDELYTLEQQQAPVEHIKIKRAHLHAQYRNYILACESECQELRDIIAEIDHIEKTYPTIHSTAERNALSVTLSSLYDAKKELLRLIAKRIQEVS